MPVGKYVITDKIDIPDYVTLRGDWQRPIGEKLGYGTILLVKPQILKGEKPEDKALFNLSGNCQATRYCLFPTAFIALTKP